MNHYCTLCKIAKQTRSGKHFSTATCSQNKLIIRWHRCENPKYRETRTSFQSVISSLRTGYKRYFGSNLVFRWGVGGDSSVGIATCYRLDGAGIESRWGARFFVLVHPGPGAHPASYTISMVSCPEVKWPGRGLDHPPSSSAEVKERVKV